MRNEILPKVKKVINESSKEAKYFDDVNIKPEHIVLSILTDNDNKCVEILKGLKIDTTEMYDRIVSFIKTNDTSTRFTPTNREEKLLPLSNDTKIVFKSLDALCEKYNDTQIDVTHLMLGLLLKPSPVNTMLYENYNFSFDTLARELKKTKSFENLSLEGDEMDEQDYKKKSRFGDTKTKTPVLDNFCRDISKAVERGEIDAVVGRSIEIKRVSQILSRRKKNNPVLIGEPGVGKTSIIEGLAQLIKDGNAPKTLLGKRIFALDLASLVAGTKYRGQFEERMKAVLEECKANPDIVLFIDELHTIVGAGNASGSLDASNIFKPALARGEIQIIGATTLDEYRENIEKDGALTRRFQQVLVDEPTLEETKIILMNIKDKYEKHHRVKYTEEAIDECVKLSARYIMDRSMPDKAIDVMDEAGASTNVNLEKPDNIKQLEIRKAELNEKKKQVILKQRYEEAAKIRDDESKLTEELKTALADWNSKLENKTTKVDVDIISEVVSEMTGIPLTKISTQETKKLMNLDKELNGRVIGQDAAVLKVVKAIKRNRIGIKDKNKPVGSFIFLGPTGVGKTMLAKLLAENVYGDADSLIRIDMSEYMEKISVSRLVGAPPGYVGYEQGGQLTEKVRRKPHCVILFDEIEKAHEDVFNILLQLLDEGQLTDGLGRKVNFKNSLIILTSNIGISELSAFGKGIGFQTQSSLNNEEVRAKEILEKALKSKFKPEFLNRIDETIIFRSLTPEDTNKIIQLELKKLEARLKENGFGMKVSKEAVEFLAKEGYDEVYGARPLARTIQHYIEDAIADEILSEKLDDGDIFNIDYDDNSKEIKIKVKSKK